MKKFEKYLEHTKWFLNYFVLTVVSLFLISPFYFYFSKNFPQTYLSFLFIIFYTIGHFGLMGLLLFLPILILSFLFQFKNLNRFVLPVIISILELLLIIDAKIFSIYKFHINGLVINYLVHGNGQIISFHNSQWMLIILICLGQTRACSYPLLSKPKL